MWYYLKISRVPFFSVGDAVVNVYINHEKKFAFVEMRTVEEASNAMALDGIVFEVCICLMFNHNILLIAFFCMFISSVIVPVLLLGLKLPLQ